MSMVTELLGARSLARTERSGCTTLDCLRPGQCARLAGFTDDVEPAVARRFHDLGFTCGAEVSVVRRAPLRDPVVYRVADYEIALRGRDAAHIAIVPAGQ